jgi:protein-S-isoprenylcysteine O-methyltransferase Ste14
MMFVFVIPTYRVYKKTGINPITFGKEDNAHNYVGNIMKILLGTLLAVIMMYSVESIYQYSVPIYYLEIKIIRIVGLIILHLSLIWIIIAQIQMSNSWRVGIDEKNKTDLVTTGLFSICRNPIFLGMIFCVFSLFLIIPNAITFCIFITVYLIIQVQIRLEEEYLLKRHGENYNNYKRKTKRLL